MCPTLKKGTMKVIFYARITRKKHRILDSIHPVFTPGRPDKALGRFGPFFLMARAIG